MGPYADPHRAAQTAARGNMYVVTHHTVVFYDRASIDDDVNS